MTISIFPGLMMSVMNIQLKYLEMIICITGLYNEVERLKMCSNQSIGSIGMFTSAAVYTEQWSLH